MINYYLLSVSLLSLLGVSWGVEVDLGNITLGYASDIEDNAYLNIKGTVEGYSMEVTCTNCIRVDGSRIYCEKDKLVAVMISLRREDQHLLVPFNVSCDKKGNYVTLRDMTTTADPHAVRISWTLSDKSTDRYIIYYMWEGKYNHTAVTNRNGSYLLEGLNERTRYRLCVANIDERSRTGKYKCMSQQTDSLETGPVEEVKATSSNHSLSLSWKRPKKDLYEPSGYIIDYRDSPGGSCGRIVITMGTSGGTPPIGDLQGCTPKVEYTWGSLQPLTIGGLRPYTDYNITILPVNRGKKQSAATERVRTKEGRSGPVGNLRTSIHGGYLRVEYDPPQRPNGVVTKYKVKVLLRRGGICDKIEDRIVGTYITSSIYTVQDLLLENLTRCGHHVIEVAAVNGWSSDGGVGETSSVTFDYKPDALLVLMQPVARPVSSNMAQISWIHPNHKDDCPKTGFLVEVANRGYPYDCVSQIIYDGGCPQLDDMLRRVTSCRHNETRNVTKEGPSWVLHIAGSFRHSETYEVKIWKISDEVLRQEGPPSISFEDQGCFTDCYDSTYVGVRSHRGCVAWKDSHSSNYHPSRVDSICTLKNADTPWCGTSTGYAYCKVPRCSLVVRATGCVRDVQEVIGTSNVTLRWAPLGLEPPLYGYVILLHRYNGICERSHLQMCDACGDEASLTEEVRAFLVSCGNRSMTKGILHRTTFDNLHQNRPYRVYIVPLVTPSASGEVRNVSIKTLMARPDTPKNLRLLNRTTQSLIFGWAQSVEDADNGPPDSYEVTLRMGASIIKSITSKTNGCTFQGLEMCTEYHASLYGKNVAGRSKIEMKLSQYTLAPSLGKVEVEDVPSEPLDHRYLSWRYLGVDTCHRSYRVRYRNKYMKTERHEETSLNSFLLTSLEKNMVYIVDVRAQTTLDTEDGRKEGRYSPGKEFYTGTVRPEIYGIEKELTSRGMRLNVSWSFNTSNDGSVFEFILLVKNASDLCISTTHFICRSCPPPYSWGNLNESNKSKREEILKCSPPQEVNFTKDNNSLHKVFKMAVPISNVSFEIYSINLVGVHNVYGGNTAYDNPTDTQKSSAVSIVMVSLLLLFLVILLVLLLKFRHQPRFLYNIFFQKPTTNGIPNKRLIPPASTIEVGNTEEPHKIKKVKNTPSSKITRNSDHLETKENLPLLEPKRRSNGVSLKDFPKHYEKMTSNKNEPLIQEYKKLTTECKKMESDLGLTVNVGKSPENTKKNRFVNILPFDQTRVIIDGKANDYTNANYIPFIADETSYEYIASQGPIEDSIDDFWQMIWRQNVNCIVMLTRTMEDNKFKCLQYWPDNIGEEQTYGNRGELTVTLQEETELESHIERVIVVKEADGEEERAVVQLHMHTWFDHSAPNLEYFDKLLFRFHELTNETATNPYLIHCSAGVGRTGTLICIDRIIKQLVNGFQEINIYETVFKLRHYRNFMVQRQAQYIFIHDYIDHFLKKYMKTDDADGESPLTLWTMTLS